MITAHAENVLKPSELRGPCFGHYQIRQSMERWDRKQTLKEFGPKIEAAFRASIATPDNLASFVLNGKHLFEVLNETAARDRRNPASPLCADEAIKKQSNEFFASVEAIRAQTDKLVHELNTAKVSRVLSELGLSIAAVREDPARYESLEGGANAVEQALRRTGLEPDLDTFHTILHACISIPARTSRNFQSETSRVVRDLERTFDALRLTVAIQFDAPADTLNAPAAFREVESIRFLLESSPVQKVYDATAAYARAVRDPSQELIARDLADKADAMAHKVAAWTEELKLRQTQVGRCQLRLVLDKVKSQWKRTSSTLGDVALARALALEVRDEENSRPLPADEEIAGMLVAKSCNAPALLSRGISFLGASIRILPPAIEGLAQLPRSGMSHVPESFWPMLLYALVQRHAESTVHDLTQKFIPVSDRIEDLVSPPPPAPQVSTFGNEAKLMSWLHTYHADVAKEVEARLSAARRTAGKADVDMIVAECWPQV